MVFQLRLIDHTIAHDSGFHAGSTTHKAFDCWERMRLCFRQLLEVLSEKSQFVGVEILWVTVPRHTAVRECP